MKKENVIHTVLLIISLVTLATVGVQFFTMKAYVQQAVENNEAMKVGGMENYEKLKTLYNSPSFKTAQQQQIDNAIAQMNGQQANAGQNNGAQQEQFPSGKITEDQIEKMKEGAYVMGDEDAKITIIEYSDPECPFCIRHHNDKTIETVMNNFKGQVNHIVKVVQGVDHAGTQYKSLALLCAGKLGGQKGYYALFDKILGMSTPQAPIATTQVPTLATEVGLDQKKFSACVDSKELLSTYTANWQEAISFQATGTPGNLIINNETGEWKLIAGAYPADSFNQVISEWVK